MNQGGRVGLHRRVVGSILGAVPTGFLGKTRRHVEILFGSSHKGHRGHSGEELGHRFTRIEHGWDMTTVDFGVRSLGIITADATDAADE